MSVAGQSVLERALDALRTWLALPVATPGSWAAVLAASEAYAVAYGAPALAVALPTVDGIYIGSEPADETDPLVGGAVSVVLRPRRSEVVHQARDGAPTGHDAHEVLLTVRVSPEGGAPGLSERRRLRLLASLQSAIANAPQIDQAGIGGGYLRSLRWRSVEHHIVGPTAIYLVSTVTLTLLTYTTVT